MLKIKSFKKQALARGFTLIELLVVIAIIGVLSSIVLASLNTARNKGADAAIKANLANVRAQAEIVYDTTGGNYGTVYDSTASGNTCSTAPNTSLFGTTTVSNAIASARSSNGNTDLTCKSAAASGDATSWAISSPLKGGSTWCVDFKGQSIGGKVAGITSNVASCQ